MKSTLPILTLVFCLLFSITNSAQNLTQKFDDIVAQSYQSDMPGATILVAKNGKAIYKKAVGKANLELDVDMNIDNVFRLASITKQFTAVAILMLEEQGKLNLSDPITKFIPDYPTHGKTITIHHLLNHTSGIKSYTSMGDLEKMARVDRSLDDLIDYFKNEPMDFDPGEQFRYNNSGYILLGKIIEVVSDHSYEDFIEQKIFQALDMKSSSFGNNRELVKNRAQGYGQGDGGYINASYISMSIPHAAGSLTSTVEDMLKWQNALSKNTLIKAGTFSKATKGSQLNNGEHITYGYGLDEMTFKGSKGYTHSGGIFGFTTNGIYLANEDIYVIGLSNCNCNDIGAVTQKLAATAVGKPFPTMKDVVELSETQLKQWEGAYEFEDGAIRHIFIEEGVLKSMRESETNDAFDIFPLADNRFMFEEGNIEYIFSKTADGKKQAIFITNEEIIGKEIDKSRPEARKAVILSNEILTQYVGKYELGPNFYVEMTIEGSQLFATATGQGTIELFAEDEVNFYAKAAPVKVRINKNDSGKVESFTLFQGGRETEAKKIE